MQRATVQTLSGTLKDLKLDFMPNFMEIGQAISAPGRVEENCDNDIQIEIVTDILTLKQG